MIKRDVELTSIFLENLLEGYKGREKITFSEILNSLHERGFGVLLMVFNLPNLLPIPGMTLIGAIPVIFFSAQMIAGFHSPWLPNWLGQKTISYENLKAVLDKYNPYIKKCEKFIKPRLLFLSDKTSGERFVGLCCFIFAVIFAAPIPLANFLPVTGVLLISIGLFNKDGMAIVIGIMLGIMGFFVALFMLIIGIVGFHKITELIGF